MAGWEIDQPQRWAAESFARIDNKIYAIYGGKEYSSILFSYNLTDRTQIDEFIRLEFSSRFARMVSFASSLYIITADYDKYDSGINYIYEYNTISGNFKKLTTFTDAVRTFTTGIVQVNGKIYIMGGQRRDSVTGALETVSGIRIYNILENAWSSLPDLPTVRANFDAIHLNDKIYCIGGLDDKGISTNSDVFDLSVGAWFSIATPFVPRSSYVATSDGVGIYIIGGDSAQGTTRSVEAYSPQSNSWAFMEPIPDSVSVYNSFGDVAAFFYDYNIFVAGAAYRQTKYFIYINTRTSRIANPSPAFGFVNERTENRLSWQLSTTPPNVPQSSAIVEWRLRDSSTVNTISVGSDQFVIIPSNTLPQGEFEWRVSATTVAGVETPFTDWLLLTTIDAIPDKPIGLFPNSGTRDGTREIQFSWVYRNPLSSPQFAFEIQTTYDNGQTWNNLTGKVESENAQYLSSPNSIIPTNATGQVGWSVRTYNTDNLSGLWSDVAFFIVHAAPHPLVWIGVESARSRPLCRWVSIGQIGFQIQVMSGSAIVFDSWEIFGTGTEYRISDFIPNGIYNFRGRIKNIRGLWSEWADFPVSINARQTLTITLTGQSIKNGAQLNFDADVR